MNCPGPQLNEHFDGLVLTVTTLSAKYVSVPSIEQRRLGLSHVYRESKTLKS